MASNWFGSTLYACALLFALFPDQSSASKILTLALMVTPSHKITFMPLLEELAAKGHEVTVISPIPSRKSVKGLKEINTFDLNDYLRMPNIFEMKEKGGKVDPIGILSSYSEVCMEGLKSPVLQSLKNESFDLIFLPLMFNECAAAWAWTVFPDKPIILLSVVSALPMWTTFYGNPSPPSFVPFLFLGYPQRMTFYQRTVALLTEAVLRVTAYKVVFPRVEVKYRQILNDSTIPSVEELIKRTSLIFSNSHFSISPIRPFLPDIIELGGMHCRPAQALPKDLNHWVNANPHGFILFSMGSTLKTSQVSLERRQSMIRALGKLKENVIWKWDEEIEDLPPNVLISKWLPQQDLLGHSKIKLFITHGGFGSTTEAVYHGVPLVGIPIFSDQELNMRENENAGIGLTLDFLQLNEDTFLKSILTVLNESKYKRNVGKLSKIFRDQPQNPLDRAVYWTEYVIRHNGAPHMMSAARDLGFFQYHSLDVIGFLLLAGMAILLTVFLCLRFIGRKCMKLFGRNSFKETKQNARKKMS